jgi:hypothetical protein
MSGPVERADLPDMDRPASPERAEVLIDSPFPEHLIMWWNFVARTREEIDAAYNDWTAAAERFGQVQSRLPRPMGRPPTT